MHLAIIGGGFSGTLLVHHMMRRLGPKQKVIWFEARPPYARGIAYGTECEAHVLNVAAQHMSALPDAPHDLLDWLGAGGADFTDAYVARRTYARYLTERFATGAAGASLLRVEKEATEVRPAGDGFEIVAGDGARVLVDRVVLAVGHFVPMAPRVAGLAAMPPERVLNNPWDTRAIANIPPTAVVASLGAGLSLVDVVLQLSAQPFQGQVVAVSRHGQWPHTHATRPSAVPLALPVHVAGSPAKLAIWLRRHAEAHVARGGDWRQVVDGLRPHTVNLWRSFGPRGQARVLRHVKSLWDAHRHRVAPHVGKQLATWRREGRLLHHAGRLERAELVRTASGAERLSLSWRLRRTGEIWQQQADVLVNCTGAHNVWPRATGRLPRALLAAGLVRPGPHNLGLAMADDGRLYDAQGQLHENLWSMGPARLGMDFESVAVPELRLQAARLAEAILA